MYFPVASAVCSVMSTSRDLRRLPCATRCFTIPTPTFLFWKPDCSLRPPVPFWLAMASAGNNSINFIITGDENPQMSGQDDPVQEERQEEMYTRVFEGKSISPCWGHEFVAEITRRHDKDGVIQRGSLVQPG